MNTGATRTGIDQSHAGVRRRHWRTLFAEKLSERSRNMNDDVHDWAALTQQLGIWVLVGVEKESVTRRSQGQFRQTALVLAEGAPGRESDESEMACYQSSLGHPRRLLLRWYRPRRARVRRQAQTGPDESQATTPSGFQRTQVPLSERGLPQPQYAPRRYYLALYSTHCQPEPHRAIASWPAALASIPTPSRQLASCRAAALP
jgi:hypothetical protein